MSEAGRSFRPYHASSALARVLIDGMFPALAVLLVLFIAWFGIWLNEFLLEEAGPDQIEQARSLVIALMAVLATVPLTVALLWSVMHRDIFRSSLELDDQGIELHKGRRVRRCRWDEIERISTLSLGRLQIATIRSPGGRIRFDSSYIDTEGPQPVRRFSLTGEHLKYPDGSTRSLKIHDNEAYKTILERAPERATRAMR